VKDRGFFLETGGKALAMRGCLLPSCDLSLDSELDSLLVSCADDFVLYHILHSK